MRNDIPELNRRYATTVLGRTLLREWPPFGTFYRNRQGVTFLCGVYFVAERGREVVVHAILQKLLDQPR